MATNYRASIDDSGDITDFFLGFDLRGDQTFVSVVVSWGGVDGRKFAVIWRETDTHLA